MLKLRFWLGLDGGIWMNVFEEEFFELWEFVEEFFFFLVRGRIFVVLEDVVEVFFFLGIDIFFRNWVYFFFWLLGW